MSTLLASRTDLAWRVLAAVLDPEVPALSVLDLGIVRGVTALDDGALEVVLTPTYSGCPAVEVIEADIVAALEVALLGPVRVRTQRAPAWTTDWISAEGRRKLREYGIAPPSRCADTAPIRFHPARPELVEGPFKSGQDRFRQAQPERRGATAPEQTVACPLCSSTNTERLSAFGATACKSLYRCIACREPFEHFKPI